MTAASPASHETATVSLTLPAALAIREGHVARQRAANASCSLWSQTLASNAGPAKTVVGSGKRRTQTTARRLRYGVARTDTSDFSAPRGSNAQRAALVGPSKSAKTPSPVCFTRRPPYFSKNQSTTLSCALSWRRQ
jgi:hypothetical protein